MGPARQNALPEAEVLEQQERLTQAWLDELEQELQQARAQRKVLQASVECIPEWEDRLTALEDDLREAERKCDLTDRTMALLEKAKDALANSYMDKIEQGFRSYTQQLFPRQLGSVMVDKDLQPHIDVRGAASRGGELQRRASRQHPAVYASGAGGCAVWRGDSLPDFG